MTPGVASHPCQLAGRLVRGESGPQDDRSEQDNYDSPRRYQPPGGQCICDYR